MIQRDSVSRAPDLRIDFSSNRERRSSVWSCLTIRSVYSTCLSIMTHSPSNLKRRRPHRAQFSMNRENPIELPIWIRRRDCGADLSHYTGLAQPHVSDAIFVAKGEIDGPELVEGARVQAEVLLEGRQEENLAVGRGSLLGRHDVVGSQITAADLLHNLPCLAKLKATNKILI